MMAQAAQESSFQPDAKASTSSATGLFQFIDSTWLNSVKQYGAKYGLGGLAQQITTDGATPFTGVISAALGPRTACALVSGTTNRY